MERSSDFIKNFIFSVEIKWKIFKHSVYYLNLLLTINLFISFKIIVFIR